MKRKVTKKKVVFTFEPMIIDFLNDNFDNKSKYVEYLIYNDVKENELLKKDFILYDYSEKS